METEKLVRDGRVAVLVSPCFGAGWSTWDSSQDRDILFDRRLIEAFEAGGPSAVEAKAVELWPDDPPYCGGADALRLEWVKQGEIFYVHEYDGNEWIVRQSEMRRA